MKKILRIFLDEFKAAARHVPRLYFMPFVGAARGFEAEWNRQWQRIQEEDHARWRANEIQGKG